MRPQSLFPLFCPVDSLPGIGPRLAKLFEKLTGPHVADLLWHLPSGLVDRSFRPTVAEAPSGRIATLVVTVESHEPSTAPRRPYRIRCRDHTGFLTLVFFHARQDWLERAFPVGEVRVVSGTVEHFNGEAQMTHPDRHGTLEELEGIEGIEAVYPLTAGLTPKVVARAVSRALERAPDLPEWIEPSVFRQRRWPSWKEALTIVHSPESEADLHLDRPARQRLAYDEMLANQLALSLVRASMRKLKGRSVAGDGSLRARIMPSLPFALTGAQERSLKEITADMAEPARMLRLLQGDVGSGKTIVALLAMLNAVETGAQAAIMAPTEILARQHFASIEPLLASIGIRAGLLTGRDKGKSRKAVLEDLAAGEIKIIVGTHALFQEDVVFQDLALAVIDEQHRFGVHQRLELAAKGRAVDVLVMTATPIPRTLTLTAYGDMDVSRLDEKPPGRQPVDTRVLPLARMEDVVMGVERAMRGGAKVYWICPLVAESETSDLAAAEERHLHLSQIFGERVGLVHGKMKAAQKDAVMEGFAEGNIDLLVSTTVVEVGVNVPEATVMVIEHAERFGLAQLHQLRGRVGRGSGASTCLLLYGSPLSETARARLEIMRQTEDGFRIAEEDLRLRGAGELLGTRQSGLPEFRVADLTAHADLLPVARDDARLILETDPELQSKRGEALRTLLYLFERDAQVRTLRSG
ncbi:ATP-dependent DNA helicase RecG [Telmatospirillum sp. J64-1]|uniref:ATP-dependent DNA helicase RecG n=1 Tax=Telmatospirillum sp. J64-1 TaxID=2502183 RepID=UPI00115C7AE2|nr:ATP-dependent DNA helicase RecG [Telmatospirillum sp. J64-1]